MWKLVIWVCVVGWGWGGVLQARATMLYNMDNITSIFERDLDDMTDLIVVNYSSPRITIVSRKPPKEFDMRAMGMLYNASYVVIDTIADKQAYPPGVVSVSDGHVYIAPLRKEWPKLLYHYAGLSALTVLVALVIVILPLSGLVWGCCSVCRKRRRRRPYDKKYDNCRKGILTLLFIALLTLFLFGVVCSFSTESQLEEGLVEAPNVLRYNLDGVRDYLNRSQAVTTWLLTSNYDQLQDRLIELLHGLGYRAARRLGEATRLAAAGRLARLVAQLAELRADLLHVHNLTQALRARADTLNAGLRKVKKQLLETLAKCNQAKCIALQNKYKIGQLDTEIQYSQMPDVTDIVSKVSSLLDTNIQAELADGEKVLADIQHNIQRSVDLRIPGVMDSLNETGQLLAEAARKVHVLADEAIEELGRVHGLAERAERVHAQYGPYRQYVGVATAALLLALMCVLVWGLMCGVCGKRPDAYGISECCNKAAGTKSLYCGVALIFAVGWVVAAVFLAYLLAGVAAQRFFCDPLIEPRNNRLFGDVEKLVDLEYELYKVHSNRRFDLTTVMVACHQNKTLFEVMQLDRVVKLDFLQTSLRSRVEEQLEELQPTLNPGGERLVILRPGAKEKLVRLAQAGLDDFDFDKILDALETNMTTLALDALARQLLSTAGSLQPAQRPEAQELRAAAAELARLNDRVLAPMARDAAALNATALRLRRARRFGDPLALPTLAPLPELPPAPDAASVEELVMQFVGSAEEAERLLNEQGPALLKNLMKQYTEVVKVKVEDYVKMVRQQAFNDVGYCGPISTAFNNTRAGACHRIVMPINGYWMSLGWCVALYVPLMVVAVRLARLYLHADPYPGPLVDAEYLYDAYADRDNVPLANAYKAEKRSEREGRGGRGREAEVRGAGAGAGAGAAGGGGAGAGVAAPLAAYHARRYNDMAPKHWEEGPPRYHGPTEYERPPPYYYPGPNDRQ